MKLEFDADKFCKHGWVWHNDDFADCFVYIVLFCPLVALLCVIALQRWLVLRKDSSRSSRGFEWVEKLQIFCCLVLSSVALIQFIRELVVSKVMVNDALLFHFLFSASWFAMAVLVLRDCQKLGSSSVLLRLWWILSFLVCSFLFRSYISVMTRSHLHVDTDFVSGGLFFISFAIQGFLAVFALFEDLPAPTAEPSAPLLKNQPSINNYTLIEEEEEGRKRLQEPPVTTASLFSRMMFSWVNDLLSLGSKKHLEHKDMWSLLPDDESTYQHTRFQELWDHQKMTDPDGPYLVRTLRRLYGAYFSVAAIWKIISDASTFAAPLFLEQLIDFVGDEHAPLWHGIAWAFGIFLASLVQSIAMAQYFYRGFKLGMNVNSAVTTAVYQKSLVLSNAARREFTQGAIVTLMSVDGQRLNNVAPYLHLLWSAPLQLIVAVALLYRLVSWSVFIGVGFMVLLMPLNNFLIKRQIEYNKAVMREKDKRVQEMTEVLAGMQVIKFFAWESSFLKRVGLIRQEELRAVKRNAYFGAGMGCLWGSTPILVALITFGTYGLTGHQLTATRVFTALSLFNILQFPLAALPMMFNFLVQTKVSVDRLNKYLRGEELLEATVGTTEADGSTVAAKIENGTFAWTAEQKTLTGINLEIPKGEFVTIIGTVGCGKSSLLAALLGNIKRVTGSSNLFGRVAYVPQQAWIQNATLRDNIVFGFGYDEKRYNEVIRVCALQQDLDILPDGDMTEIGERGINLSGGQKQRVSLARACYSPADILLLDDPLSAVDVHVGRHIMEECITKFLKGKTIIMVSHQMQFLPMCDRIVVVTDGKIEHVGTYDELTKAGVNLRQATAGEQEEAHSEDEAEEDKDAGKEAKAKAKSPKEAAKLIEKEGMERGIVKFHVWKLYALALGGIGFSAVILFAWTFCQSMMLGQNYWLSFWSDQSDTDRNLLYYLGIYAALGLAGAFMLLVKGLLLAKGSVNASTVLHEKALQAVMLAPMSFFDTTPLGRILNRFSSDTSNIDSQIRSQVSSLLNNFFTIVGIVVIICVATPFFVSIVVFLVPFYWYVQKFYRQSSRELKRLDSVSKSPIYAHFGETLSGTEVIRAYNVQQRFREENFAKVNKNLRANYPGFVANRWLALRLEFIGAFVVAGAAGFAVLEQQMNNISPGLVGLSLSYALQITSGLNYFVRSFTMVETNLVSVERLNEYSEENENFELEPPQVIEGKRPPLNWPSQGRIEFKHLNVRYRPGLPLILKDFTATIQPGEKIGVVGRTGAGKSSLLKALFRIIHVPSNSVIIDGVDISSIGLADLRSRMAIIPQDPVLFSGTIRSNLDPFDEYSDSDVWSALERIHLRSMVEQLPEKLQAPVQENGDNFSVGERQLLCMGRALLRPTKILVLDEATAAVDMDTDDLIQQTIRQAFASRTVLTIAHRINTIMDSDRVMVLDQGQLIEMDSPSSLIANPSSAFAKMVKESQQ